MTAGLKPIKLDALERVERLMAAGMLRPAGLAAIERAKAIGSWTAIDAVEAMVMADDLAKALAEVTMAQRHFDAFPQSVRKAVLQRLAGVRTAATRSKRFAETVRLTTQNQRPGAS